MKVITLLSQKGGTGKTTLAVHLATEAMRSEHLTAVIDLDPQGSATAWADRRGHEPEVISAQAVRLPHLLATAKANRVARVFIDTGPAADQIAARAAAVADLIVVPCRPSIFDLDAIEASLAIAHAAQKRAVVVLNGVAPYGTLAAEAAQLIVARNAHLAPVTIGNRTAFVRAITSGHVAAELAPRSKAADELAELARFLELRLTAPKRTIPA